ncbi:hypothetical protein [Methylocystis sp. JR02]|uniref:hypothetical protein n=1 Tax=Methylocystis sp. JR02 TaxID=3046284 RepID=UPI0024BB5981|nr:hypothetical protein [Methylocystis sp. JR02]MDJ0449278.1 hypothetical protein [Methylocystis sp. JR02]
MLARAGLKPTPPPRAMSPSNDLILPFRMTAIKMSRQAGKRARGADAAPQQNRLSRSRDGPEWLGSIYDKRGKTTILDLPDRSAPDLNTKNHK